MNNSLEVKKHDGPGRIALIGKMKSPCVINRDELEIAPIESMPYNIDRELAEMSIEANYEKSKDFIKNKSEKETVSIIQGSKFTDLRIENMKKLEDLSYRGFIIANADDLLLNPKRLVEMIVELKKEMKPESYLIFPFTITEFMPLLVYMGVDVFLDDSAEYFSYKNIMFSPNKNYNLNDYKIYEMEQEELCEYNKKILDYVSREINEHMNNGTLRNLVEERSLSSPQNVSTLKILDREYQDYLDKYTQLY